MAGEGGVKVAPAETIESLMREAETLKIKLEDERQKLNDVTCKLKIFLTHRYSNIIHYACSGVCCRKIRNY